MNTKSDKNQTFSWPLDPNYDILLTFMIILYPWGLAELYLRKVRKEKRKQLKILTNSILMSSAKYVGGHPLLPTSSRVVLRLTKDQFEISLLDNQACFSIFSSIPLLDIIRTGTGKPKTAREIYDEDNGHTIDVIEGSPFLHIVFKMDGENYFMSFEKFDESLPQEWHNQIVHLQYLLKHGIQNNKAIQERPTAPRPSK